MSKSWKRILSVVLALVMALGLAIPASAEDEFGAGEGYTWEELDGVERMLPYANNASSVKPNQAQYQDDEIVRVSIFLEAAPVIELYPVKGIGTNAAAASYRKGLERAQISMAERISAKALNGSQLDVVHGLTLAANAISANVPYGAIEAIKAVDGVKNVVLETRYEPAVASTGAADPQMSTSSAMIGSSAAWAAGYTGVGSKVAVIDTGLAVNHISFDPAAFEYALRFYDGEVDLLDEADIEAVWNQLNISAGNYRPRDVYQNAKTPFAFNYVDNDLDVTHANDSAGEHGSHVAGIAAANRFVQVNNEFVPALDEVHTQGVAPDAQILVMKVFGKGGGAYDSDYFLAIEDAIVLGADAINLSLGSAVAGMATSDSDVYQNILDDLQNCGATVSISAGNNSYWAEQTWYGDLYEDGANFATGGSPGTYANAFTVASVDNAGMTGNYVTVGGQNVFYTETSGYGNAAMTTIAGTHDYVYVDGVGVSDNDYSDNDFADLDLTGKIALCNRGSSSFFIKANAAVSAGAIGVIIVNNQGGTISMNLTGYEHSAPAVSITLADGALFKTGEPTGTAASGADIYEGTVTVAAETGVMVGSGEPYTMSDFSSWGANGNLELKPEITAPGGNIYSVNGMSNTGYENMSGTSMAAPQVAGMAAVLAQYIRENDLTRATGKSERFLVQSLLSSTAEALKDANGNYYSVLSQGAGLANVNAAINARSYIEMDRNATQAGPDGKIKVELGDDPERGGAYFADFTISNFSEEDVVYKLSGTFFTQNKEDGFLTTDTVEIPAELSFTVDGQQPGMVGDIACDLDGDGDTDGDDVQALLDHIVLGETEPDETYGAADLDDDGVLTTYDAYLLLEHLNTAAVTVQAGRSVAVEVDIVIDMPAEYDVNGAWVEGYLFAEAQLEAARDGGEPLPEIHSIPVLGYYGSWLEPAMFDSNTVYDYYYGDGRLPYMTEAFYGNGSYETYEELFEDTFSAGYYVRPYGESYAYALAGNPFVPDEEYHPERNAINGADAIAQLYFSQIRNAGATRLLLTSDGETLLDESVGSVYAAYYYPNDGLWHYYLSGVNLGLVPERYGLEDGDELTIRFSAVPEYYMLNGEVDWDALPDVDVDQYSMSYSMTIDNVNPRIIAKNIRIGNGKMRVPVGDNCYVAAVVLANDNYEILDVQGAREDLGPGRFAGYKFTFDPEVDQHLLIQVYDYAGNYATYRINLNEEELTDEYIYYNHSITLSDSSLELLKDQVYTIGYEVTPWGLNSKIQWLSSDPTVATVDENGRVTAVGVGEATIAAISRYRLSNGRISKKTATCQVTVSELDITLRSIVWDEVGDVWPTEFNTEDLSDLSNKLTHEPLDVRLQTIAYDSRGNMYGATLNSDDYSSAFYAVDPETYETTLIANSDIGFFDLAPAGAISNMVYAVYGPYVLGIDTRTGDLAVGSDGYSAIFEQFDENLVGLTYLGAMPSQYGYVDILFCLGESGNVYYQFCIKYQGSYYTLGSGLEFSFGEAAGALNYQSLYYVYDEEEDAEYVLWSRFENENQNLLVAKLFYDADGNTIPMVLDAGSFPAGVWPVSGLHESLRRGRSVRDFDLTNASLQSFEGEISMIAAAPAAPKGGLNAVSGTRAVNPEVGDENVTVTVTADEAANNGLFTLTYDPEHLTYAGIDTPIAVYSAVDVDETAGTVTFGFATVDTVAADGTLFTVSFTREDEEATAVTVTAEELNDDLTAAEPEEVEIEGTEPEPPTPPTPPTPPGGTTIPEDEVPLSFLFDDVQDESAFYFDPVYWAVEKNVTKGTSATTFSPDNPCTRSEIVTFLYRAAGEPEVGKVENPFTDVEAGSFYEQAVLWAVEKGITKGTSATTFSPTELCTRGQIVTFLWRAFGSPAADAASFTDVAADAFYADAVAWAVAKEITKGTSATTFSPDNVCTRGESVTFLYRAYK